MAKPHLTLEQHRHLGLRLKAMRDGLVHLRQALISAGGKHRAARGVSTTDGMTDLEQFELERRRMAVSMEPIPPW